MRLADRFDAFLIDLDGTVISGGEPVARAVASLKKLRKTGKPFLFVTNNARHTNAKWAALLRKIGIEARPEEIVTSASSTAFFIRRKFTRGHFKRAFVSGGTALRSEIKKTGILMLKPEEVADGCDAVILGGHENFCYADIAAAGIAIRAGAKFFATNSNFVYPSKDRILMPATGALAAAIEKVSGARARITGKPSREIFRMCLQILKTPAMKTAVIGDSLRTDIKGGKNAGMKTILTLTGISSLADAKKSRTRPDRIIKNLSELF